MATLRIIAGSYVVDCRDAAGTRRRHTLGKVGILPEKLAKKALRQIELETSPAYAALNPATAPMFGQFVKDYLKWHAAEYPASHARVAQIVDDYLLPEFEYDRMDAITPKRTENWKHKRLAPRKGAPKSQTVTKELRTLKAVLNKAVEWDELGKNPIVHVSAPKNLDSKPPRFFTQAELDLIYAACRVQVNGGKGMQPDPLHAHIWRLYANTGMRRTEGMILRRTWIGQEAMKILSTEEDRTKSGKWREIPLTVGALEALDELPGGDGYVLPRVALPSLSRACAHDIRRARVQGGSLQTLRHTYISHLVMAGVPLRTVQQFAGHSSILVTEKYAHLAPSHLNEAGRRISL